MDPVLTPSHHVSSSLEKVLEHRLLAALTTELWLRGVRDFEVLRGEVDAHGYDLVVEACGTLRHIQLKAMVRGGKRRDVSLGLALARKPSGCVIWMMYDPDTLELGPYLWFGGGPGDALPALGEKLACHSKGDSLGVKSTRARHRSVSRSRFEKIESVQDLVTTLFGRTVLQGSGSEAHRQQVEMLREHLAKTPFTEGPEWLQRVHAGQFECIPDALEWEDSIWLGHLIDGYCLVQSAGWGDPFRFADERLAQATAAGEWLGGPAELWASLFLEHRRWRMSPVEPGTEMRKLLDCLCRQLCSSLS